MKEFAPPAFETQEARHTPEHHEAEQPAVEKAKKPVHHETHPKKTLHEARKTVQETARSEAQHHALKQLEEAENESQVATPRTIDSQLRKITLRRELKGLQRKLPAPQRALSKIVHQPVVRAVSEATGKTISRPSGLLGGGLMALFGTSIYLYMARHLGFKYNYMVFLVLFAGGFIIGLILEFLVWAMTARQRKDS